MRFKKATFSWVLIVFIISLRSWEQNKKEPLFPPFFPAIEQMTFKFLEGSKELSQPYSKRSSVMMLESLIDWNSLGRYSITRMVSSTM